MDATRADVEFTAEVCQIAIDEGATTINIPDTVGYTMPRGVHALPDAALRASRRGCKDVVVSTHCHDDLGLAVANSFAGVLAGARQVECAVNGIGERAGNASLEEIVMLLHTRGPISTACTPASSRRSWRAPAASCRGSPATSCSPTRRSSGATRSRTSPASTRTACSRSARRSRSWTPRRSASTPTRSCSASTPGATRCARRSRSSASRSTARR